MKTKRTDPEGDRNFYQGQQLIWLPKGVQKPGIAVAIVPNIPYSGPEPRRLWTLYLEQDERNPPALPFEPAHRVNAFLEDKLHDWDIRQGALIYRSRVSDGGCWCLLEF